MTTTTVTIDVPPPCDAVPAVDGDAALVADFAEDMLATATNLDDFDTFTHDSETLEGWTGSAAQAYRSHTRAAGTDGHAISTAVRQVARSADVFAEELTALGRRRDDLVEARAAYHASRAGLLHDITMAQATGRDEIADLQDRSRTLATRLATLIADVEQLLTDVTTAEQAMIDAFSAYGSLAQARAAVSGQADLADAALLRAGSPTSGAAPEEVARWWAGLSEDEQFAVLAAHPEVLGGTDGIPARVRDRANRVLLSTDLEALELRESRGDLPYQDRAALENARAAQTALAAGALDTDPITGEPLIPLLHLYDPRSFGGDGRVAITFGDPDTADHVSVMVPGMTSRGTSAEENTEYAYSIYESARFSNPGASVASVMWIGYDAPSDGDVLTVARETRAKEGGEMLSTYVDGLRASREGSPAHLTVIGHSYGSTTTAHSATGPGLSANDVVLVGSPGAGGGVSHADELEVDRVWAGNNTRDLVAGLADNGWVGGNTFGGVGMGNNVTEDTFGATRFEAESITRNSLWKNTGDHVKYFHQDTESIYNIGHIVAGNGDAVQIAEHSYDPWWGPPIDPEASREPQQWERTR
ncbi:alpha/beta hydrolase [Actinotalea sp. C106]|uniref:alpha/beta hydrolase n=1 Tax=Actinotalea sp. C106 TaxID=2908644 RepID=UPI002027AFF8|nr:alpha/beta hydrolase [Actinotalea sp. C106]